MTIAHSSEFGEPAHRPVCRLRVADSWRTIESNLETQESFEMTTFEWTEFLKTAQARVAALDPQTLGILVLLGAVGIVSIFRREMQARVTLRLA